MFTETRAYSGFSAPDIDAAQAFYAGTLGVRTSANEGGILTLHLAGGTDVIVYPKADHEPAGFTVLNFQVEEIEAAVDGLVERGVEILRYDGVPLDERGIMREGGPFIAWFTDPAGNTLSVLQQR